ncbi:Lanthionine synthetase C-like protein [Williamwhitmania taraxaci]|uniref:Lanthionine synthetase C-like protein n=2 Tax=Williamwhitmania taraxaci TaxID=1640674 RepID=A0A1G6TF02_9BACT|nr:Lanthionine synthetase C-like protein [Williamwhitmania taraxaci]
MVVDSLLAVQLNQKIDAIAQHIGNSTQNSPDLMSGKSGEMLFLAYYHLYKNDETKENKTTIILSSIFDEIKRGFKYPTFCNGLAGIGWTVEHLVQHNFIKADTNKIIGSLDDFLYPYMMHYIREGNYDYLHGALGLGLYYSSRKSSERAHGYLIDLVAELDRQATRMDQGIAWERKLKPDSDVRGYNLSMSHGIASIITILSRLYEAGICKDKTLELATGAVTYLLSNRRTADAKYLFPGWVCKEETEMIQGGRLAWCYYDMGISIALWQAGQLFGSERWKKEAIDILLHTTRILDLKEGGIHDAGICHGAAGIAHIYHRMYRYTNVDAFRIAAIFWFEQCIKMASFDDGLAGYKTFQVAEYGGWQKDYGLLNGIAGIGLAMISFVSDIEPDWDSALLLS